MAKLNYYSINESEISKNLRRLFVVPVREAVHRGVNRVYKKIYGGLLPFPQNVHVEMTNKCNLHCIMCPIDQQTRKKGFMAFETFEKIIKQCKGQFSIEKMALMGLGEPFLHPEIIPMSRYAKDHGIPHVFTSTNATFLNETMAEEIITKSGFDLISFSMDGATKETYEKIRVNSNFDRVQKNILNFLEIRKKCKKKKPRVNMQILVMRETHREVDQFVLFWNEKLESQDTIFIRDVDTFGGQVEDHRTECQLPKIKRIACIQLWRDFAISWDGMATVCCKDVLYQLKVANIFENSIVEIWKSQRWERIRQIHKSGEYNKIPLCCDCNEWNQ